MADTDETRRKRDLAPDHCELCPFTAFVQRHRIKPGREGGKYRVGNVIAVCGNCHGLIELKDKYTRQELWDVVAARLDRWLEQGRITPVVWQNSIAYIALCHEDEQTNP